MVMAVAPVAVEYVFTAQSTHEPSDTAPVLMRYLPAPQSVHVDAPTVVKYLPAPQSVHVDTPTVVEYLPAGQSVHAALPAVSLYLPATQAVHVCPSRPVMPGLHRQSERNAEPRDEFELAGQLWHVGLPVSDHVPASHALHVSMPSVALKVPAAHALHVIGPEFVKPAGHSENWQVPPACSMNPGMQTQLLRDEAPGTEVVVLAGQALH